MSDMPDCDALIDIICACKTKVKVDAKFVANHNTMQHCRALTDADGYPIAGFNLSGGNFLMGFFTEIDETLEDGVIKLIPRNSIISSIMDSDFYNC